MALEFNEVTKSYNVSIGDIREVTEILKNAEEVLYDPVKDMWEVDGALFSSVWLADQVVIASHLINVIAHMQLRKGNVNPEKMAEVVEKLNDGKVPATRSLKKKKENTDE